MFYYVKGTLVLATPNTAVVDVSGVAYKLTISESTYASLPHHRSVEKPPEVLLYTHLSVREDGIELFGFGSEGELSTFKMLQTVSGVGPKAAISILSLLTPEKFALAVCTDDKKTIAKANGIGPKTAARIILELKDKLLKQTDLGEAASAVAQAPVAAGSTGVRSEAQDALLVLGYTRAEAQSVLATIDTANLSLEDIIREALKKLMRQ